MLYCLPSYVQKLKSQTSKTICVRKWSDECINTLKSCFDCTVWEELYDDGCELDQNVDVCSSYIQFCTDVIVPRKAVTVFPNNKPWITKDVKEVINKKKRALSGDRTNLKEIQKELNCKISDAKLVYKDKVEGLFKSSRSREAWKGLKYLCGCTTKNCMPEPDDVNVYVDELNNFYARFDVGDFKSECDEVLNIVNNKASTRIIMSDDDVVKALNTAKPGKASGPDKVCARVVKNCRYELVKPMRYLFQASLDNCEVPSMWKTSEIVPVPKVKIPQVKNDLRPVALTSVLMKCLESFVKKYLCKQVQHVCDKLQFAYRARRSVDDAVITLLDSVCSHLDKSRTYSRILFIDFSSAFNTIKPHIMIRKLYDMNVNCNLIKWIFSYLTLRPQYVKLGHVRSNSIVTNTGAPQGCVLSPLLFTLYTNDCTSSFNNCIILKYADDTVIIGNIFDNDTSSYKSQVESFVKWCDSNFLDLNVRKTKEMIMDFRKDNNDHDALFVKNENVNIVESYKYLGVFIDSKLSFSQNCHHLYIKCIRRVCYLRQLVSLRVSQEILTLFYKTIIESVLSFCIIAWFGSSNKKDQKKMYKVIRYAKRVGIETENLVDICNKYKFKMTVKIIKDEEHPLHDQFVFLRSGKRLMSPKQRTNRYSNTFVPSSIKYYNYVTSKHT
jgi:hypothetical protein